MLTSYSCVIQMPTYSCPVQSNSCPVQSLTYSRVTLVLFRPTPVLYRRRQTLELRSCRIEIQIYCRSTPVHLHTCSTATDLFETFPCLVQMQTYSRPPLVLLPRREAGDVWCLPPVWNLRAVIWFHFAISSLVLLPSPVTLPVLSFSACWPFLLNFFQKILQYLSLRDRLFCMAPV